MIPGHTLEPRPLRIGVDARELQGRPTGVGRYLRGLLEAWPREDTLLLFVGGGARGLPAAFRRPVEFRALGNGTERGLVFQERLLPGAAQGEGVDVFFSPAYSCPISLKVPCVTAIHDMSFFSLPEDFTLEDGARRRALASWSVKRSRAILALSEFTRREIEGRFPGVRTLVVPPGADDDIPAAERRPSGTGRLLSVGSILNRRCLPQLLEAVAWLKHRNREVFLDVVGENRTHPLLDLEALLARLDLVSHVRFRGFVSEAELAHLYAEADVAVYLSEYEGFGLPVAEAMTRGVPVVTTVRPATGEVFKRAALTVDPLDSRAIAGAIARVLEEPSLREGLVAEGRSLVSGMRWTDSARRAREAFQEAVS